MQKLTSEHLAHLANVASLANLVGIESVIIGNEAIRGISENKSVAIINDVNGEDCELPFDNVALNMLPQFVEKVKNLTGMDDIDVGAEVDDEAGYARKIIFKGLDDSRDTDYIHLCANPAIVQAPKSVKDDFKKAILEVPAGANALISKFVRTMESETLTIKGSKEGIHIQLKDVVGNYLNHKFNVTPAAAFNNRYSLKTMRLLFAQLTPESKIEIGSKGVMRVSIQNLDVYILPMV